MAALQNANDFNVNVLLLVKTNFPRLEIMDAVQYGAVSAQNSQGSAVGEIMQVICTEVMGQQTVTAGFSEKLRSGPVVMGLSDFTQKMSSGTWGTIVYRPLRGGHHVGYLSKHSRNESRASNGAGFLICSHASRARLQIKE